MIRNENALATFKLGAVQSCTGMYVAVGQVRRSTKPFRTPLSTRTSSPQVNPNIILFPFLSSCLLHTHSWRSVFQPEATDDTSSHHPLWFHTTDYILSPTTTLVFLTTFLSTPLKNSSGNVTGRNDKNNRNTVPIISHLCHSIPRHFYVLFVFCIVHRSQLRGR